ncbi:MAG TPA: (d)CMP kinase [Alphaproteobacteria bacterium]|nr:(d)CMP kinase [Alphaproteobacteria bacterium]
MIIAIDGPAGAGKGTLAQNLVSKYGFRYLDTGALFRAVALCLIKDEYLTKDNLELKAIFYAKNLDFDFTRDFKITLEGIDVTNIIRNPETGAMASKIATIPQVRVNLDEFQKNFAKKYRAKGVILDGRDMGTFIAPDAPVKVFLDCAPEVRAKRRVEQLEGMGQQANYQEILDGIIKRDTTDRTRDVRPMVPAIDSIKINTCENSIDDVVIIVSNYIDSILDKKKETL